MFKFKGISSNDMQVIVEEEEEFIARAAHKYEQIDVDGRDGAEFNELGYSVVERPIRVQCLNVDKVDEILAWLNGEGEFEYKGRKTIARFYSELEPKRSSWIRIIDTTFIRDPFWYKANEEYLLVKDDKNKNVSGESIHIEDSSDARCELEIGGNQKQDTREGYNQFKITSTSTKSAGITITKVDESSVSYQGTTTGLFTHILVEYDGNGLEITKQMYLKAFGNLTNAILSVKLIKNGKTESSYVRVSPNLILSAGDVLQQIYVQQQNTGILVSGTLQVLLTDYENKDKPYEQYGASPSLDYPSPVKSVGDNVNLFPGWEMGTIDVATGNKITDPYYIRSVDFIPILPNIDYTLYQINSFGFDSLNTALRLYDKDKKYLGNQYLGEILVKSFAFKISNPSVRFMIPTSTNGQTNVIPKNAKVDIKLEKGIIATPYSPYNYGSAKVDIKNENIFNTENVKSTSEVSVVDNKNGLLKLQGVNGFWKGITTTQKFETGKRVYVKCKVVEGTGSSGNIGIKDTNGDDILENYKVSNNLISCSFISKGITKIFFRCNGTSNNGNIKYSDIMFSYEDIDYVPNQEQSYLVDVQQPMFEGDTFVKQDGKWYEKHNWKTMSFDGQNMGSQAGGSFADFKENGNIVRVFEIKDLLISSVRNDIFCDKLPRQADSMWNGKSTGIQSWQGQNKILISLPFDDVEKKYGQKLTVDNYVTAFYMYLQNEVLIISYPLAEPKLLECTETQSKELDEIYNKIHTYKNITNILAESAEVNPIINVEYLVETNEKIINDGNYISSPILRLEKTKYNDVELTINDIRFKYHFEQDKYVEIDCEQKSVKCDGVDRYRQIEIDYKFPKLNLKENNIIMHLGDCKIKVLRKDRWL